MRDIFNNLNSYFSKLSTIKYICIILLLTYVVFIPLFPFFKNYDIGGPKFIIDSSFIIKLIGGSIIIPLIETFIFQYLIIEYVGNIKKFKDKKFLIAVISAVAFSLSHYYNAFYIFYSFILGLFLAYTYILYKNKGKNPFIVVMILHALRNLITTLILTFF